MLERRLREGWSSSALPSKQHPKPQPPSASNLAARQALPPTSGFNQSPGGRSSHPASPSTAAPVPPCPVSPCLPAEPLWPPSPPRRHQQDLALCSPDQALTPHITTSPQSPPPATPAAGSCPLESHTTLPLHLPSDSPPDDGGRPLRKCRSESLDDTAHRLSGRLCKPPSGQQGEGKQGTVAAGSKPPARQSEDGGAATAAAQQYDEDGLCVVWDSAPRPEVRAARSAWRAVPLGERISWTQTSDEVNVYIKLPKGEAIGSQSHSRCALPVAPSPLIFLNPTALVPLAFRPTALLPSDCPDCHRHPPQGRHGGHPARAVVRCSRLARPLP